MKILFQQLFYSCNSFAIYQLSSKNVEKCQKSLIALALDTIHPRKKLLKQNLHDFRF
jgi:hypothetical protein